MAVTLKACASDAQVATTVSSATGSFSFDNLIPGCYYVEFGVPTGSTVSPKHNGTDTSKDSDIDAAGVTEPYTLVPGVSDTTVGAGFSSVSLATIGHYVWQDANGNGQQDADERGIPGVVVTLKTTAGVTVATTSTDGLGVFTFDNVVPGNYVVEFSTPMGSIATRPNVGSDATDSDADASGKAYVSVLNGTTLYNVDAGFAFPGSLSSLLFLSPLSLSSFSLLFLSPLSLS